MQALDESTYVSAGTSLTNYKTPSANSAFALGEEPNVRLLSERCHMESDHELESTKPAGTGGVSLRAKTKI